MNLNSAIKKRASIREFSLKKVKYDKIIDIIEAGNLAPSPGNLSIISFIIIEDEETIKEIAKACQQNFISKAQFVIAVISDSKTAKKFYDERAEKYVPQHSGAVIENMLLKITDVGLATCWVGAFSDLTLKRTLKLPDVENIKVEAILPIGYPSNIKSFEQKPKTHLGNVVFFEEWGNQYQKAPAKREV
jgi:nitroreductase